MQYRTRFSMLKELVKYNEELEKQFSGLKVEKIQIINAKHNIFVCGGEIDITYPFVKSYRQQLFQHTASVFPEWHNDLIAAEEFKDYYRNGNYRDLLTFEDDIASISSIVLIILESEGALVELGLYCSRDRFLDKLLVVVDEEKSPPDSDSFISLGPLQFLRSHNNSTVLYHEFPKEKNAYSSDVDDLCSHIETNLSRKKKREGFDKRNNRHIAYLVAEIVRIAFPIMLTEILDRFTNFDINLERSRLQQLIYVLEKMEIVVPIQKSDNVYYCPRNQNLQFASFGTRVNGKVFVPDEVLTLIRNSFIHDENTMSQRRKRALDKYKRDFLS